MGVMRRRRRSTSSSSSSSTDLLRSQSRSHRGRSSTRNQRSNDFYQRWTEAKSSNEYQERQNDESTEEYEHSSSQRSSTMNAKRTTSSWLDFIQNEIYRWYTESYQAHFAVQTPRDVWEGLWEGLINVWGGCQQLPLSIIEGITSTLTLLRGSLTGSDPAAGRLSGGSTAAGAGSSNNSTAAAPSSTVGPLWLVTNIMTVVVGGVIQGTLLTVGGIAAGVQQIARGAWNTPKAWRASAEGNQLWDAQRREWRTIHLEDELRQVQEKLESLTISSQGDSTTSTTRRSLRRPKSSTRNRRGGRRRKVTDMTYYHMLNVSPDATHAEIKQAYFQQALMIHPDKQHHRGSDSCSSTSSDEDFWRLNTAYRTLQNDQAREAYDQYGLCFVEQQEQFHQQQQEQQSGTDIMDTYTFFAVLFGSHLVESYIGELKIATFVETLLLGSSESYDETKATTTLIASDPSNQSKVDDLQQKQRVLKIATFLRSRVANVVEGHETMEDFRTSCRLEAMQIARGGSLGKTSSNKKKDDFLHRTRQHGTTEPVFETSFLKAIASAVAVGSRKYLTETAASYTIIPRIWGVTKQGVGTRVHDLVEGYQMTQSAIQTIASLMRSFLEWRARRRRHHEEREQARKKQQQKASGEGSDKSRASHRSNCDPDDIDGMKKLNELVESLEKTVPVAVKFVWQMSKSDIHTTLREACAYLLHDGDDDDVSSVRRQRRAEALLVLADEFYSTARQEEELHNAKHRRTRKRNRNKYVVNDEEEPDITSASSSSFTADPWSNVERLKRKVLNAFEEATLVAFDDGEASNE